ncbi:hypothetical protein JQ543_12325 [Bradyrhizobium diazoefficiens]|nr:hypothetical protein [Bradyrhizobium diazoefficiens]MBR0773433.1 hypothetical protein [Bradyrhizobium diazoefficiens]MBR0848529.1 hypothetical protein [Bradyrhizobium diazoefficiens]
MTNEAIKALMILAMYGALEILLFSPSIGRFAKHAVQSRGHRTTGGEFTRRD